MYVSGKYFQRYFPLNQASISTAFGKKFFVIGGPIIIDSRDGNAIINSDQDKVIEPINTNVIDNWNYTTPNLNIPILPDKVRNHTLPEIGGNSTVSTY